MKDKGGGAHPVRDAEPDYEKRIAELEAGLTKSVEFQSFYARLLNLFDGGKRAVFANSEEWLERLARLKAMGGEG